VQLKENTIGYMMMPLVKNVPHPASNDWKRTTCPQCGAACWDRVQINKEVEKLFCGKLCTKCALSKV